MLIDTVVNEENNNCQLMTFVKSNILCLLKEGVPYLEEIRYVVGFTLNWE